MPRIPESEIARIKQTTDLVTLCQSRGIKLRKVGRNYVGRCPFHEETKDSFTVNPADNLWHCFGCGIGGDAIRLVELLDKCSFTEAVKKLRPAAVMNTRAVKRKKQQPYINDNMSSLFSEDSCLQQPEQDEISPLPVRHSFSEGGNRSKLLGLVADFYHAAFTQLPEGKTYLVKRGLTDQNMLSRFKTGFCSGTIRQSMPQEGRMLEDLKTLGVLTSDGREFFRNCLVFPIPDLSGQLVNLYGRRIRDGQVNHLYLPGPKSGVFNGASIKHAESIILVESVLDALALIQAGYSGAIPIYGSGGLLPDHLELLKQNPDKPVYLCFDGDDAGRACTSKVKDLLADLGIDARTIHLTDSFDPASLILEKNGKDIFRKLFRQAGGQIKMDINNKGISPPKITCENGCFRAVFPDLTYEIKNPNGEKSRSRITLKVFKTDAGPSRFHLDTIDLYSARSRSFFARAVAEIFGLRDAQVSAELLVLIDPLEKFWAKSRQSAEPSKPSMTDQEKQAAHSLLTAPDLFDRILSDFETAGLTGEETNKLVGYIAAVSRKLPDPLSICIQSRSAAGKSALQDAILNFVPPEDVIRYTRLTGQALFYKAGDSLKHKIIAIEEDIGARDATYSIRTIQSSKQLSIASAGRDPQTGKLSTDEHRVEGPVSVFLTTTEPDIESETASRFIFLSIDESPEATARIQETQRISSTLEGLVMKKRAEKITRFHQNAQRLLEDGLTVVIPFSEHLTYRSDSLRMRRDHMKYLTLIMAITYLHQHQRQIKTKDVEGTPARYAESTLEDVRMANKLAATVLGNAADELSPPSRRLLGLIRDMVIEKSGENGIEPQEYTFTRRDIREYSGWSDMQVKRHINQLVDLEFLFSITGSKGKEYIYELRYMDEVEPGKKFLSYLVDVDDLSRKLGLQS